MASHQSSPPTIQQMGARIFKNLSRVQNYLDILKSEIEHPQKSGPGSSPEDWLEATEALRESLTNLEYLLKSGDLEATNEE